MDSGVKVAIVTGAGSGVGRHSALALLDLNFHVVLAGRRPDALQETVALAGERASLMQPVVTDVCDPDSVTALFREAATISGRIDLLFNNAGIGAPVGPLEELSLSDWQRVLDVNLTGAFLCTQEAMKRMKSQEPQGGRIINNGSVSAQVPRPQAVAYTASKCGLTGLTETTSLEGRGYNIACGQIDIGNADTAMGGRVAAGMLQANRSTCPEPTMHVDNVARAVAYMASLPLDANVLSLTVMATEMPLVGRG